LLYGLRLFHTLNEVGMITHNASLKERIESVRKPIKNLLRKVSFYVIVTTISLLLIAASLIIPIIMNKFVEKQVFLAVIYSATVFIYSLQMM
jgi:hypothetical protein